MVEEDAAGCVKAVALVVERDPVPVDLGDPYGERGGTAWSPFGTSWTLPNISDELAW